jgi:hypothetical protein
MGARVYVDRNGDDRTPGLHISGALFKLNAAHTDRLSPLQVSPCFPSGESAVYREMLSRYSLLLSRGSGRFQVDK